MSYRAAIIGIATVRTERGVYAVLSQGSAISDTMVPIDTGTLLNSRFIKIDATRKKTVGRAGYTAAYSASVHEASGKLRGQPRANFGKTSNHSDFGPQMPQPFGGGTGVGDYWDPNAEPNFLKKGFEELQPQVPEILEAIYRV